MIIVTFNHLNIYTCIFNVSKTKAVRNRIIRVLVCPVVYVVLFGISDFALVQNVHGTFLNIADVYTNVFYYKNFEFSVYFSV